MRIILAGIAGGIAMFIWSFCSHTVLPAGGPPSRRRETALRVPHLRPEPSGGWVGIANVLSLAHSVVNNNSGILSRRATDKLKS